MRDAVAVLDLGKTNLKLLVVGPDGRVLDRRTAANTPRPGPPYLHADVEHVWRWLLGALEETPERGRIAAIVPTAYGSTAALVDDGGLALPVMDYEADPPAGVKAAYAGIAPPYSECFAPTNPAGLTLARQLLWQSMELAEGFDRAKFILPYAQYWSWRLSGVAASEVTSIGAQTHLWNPLAQDFSSLVDRLGWRGRFAPFAKAWQALGPIMPVVAEATGLPAGTTVLCGIHDSSANHLRYLAAGLRDVTLMSTGTWLINFNPSCSLHLLDENRDAVSNTDAFGDPMACSRFMAGREYVALARDAMSAQATAADVARVIGKGTMALPSFSDSGGPIPGTGGRGRIVGPSPADPAERLALAALYTALMSSAALDVIHSANPIVVDGGMATNTLYVQLMAALRPGQPVQVSGAPDGTALGAALLWGWQEARSVAPPDLVEVPAPAIPGLADYATAWRAAAERAGAL